MATAAQYAATSVIALATLITANTARDGTGTLATVISGASTGTRVDDLTIIATATTTVGVIRLYVTTDGGTTNRLLREILVTAIVPSTTVATFTHSISNLGLLLPNTNSQLRASTHIGEAFNVLVTRAGNF